MEYIFWFAFILVFYSYVIYPILLSTIVAVGRSSNSSADGFAEEMVWPKIAIIIAAYNEELDIVKRLKNLAELDYPDEKIMVYIGSDGSTDTTNSLIEECSLRNLKFFPYSERRGKASVLNDLCAEAEGDILVFSDANTLFDTCAVKNLVYWFKDESVGGVCGELEIHSSVDGENHDGLYWRYEKFLKINENKIGALLGANGAIYAIRKKLYKPLLPDTIIDDFMIGMNIVLQEYKMIYKENAIAHEYAPDTVGHEFKRRTRIGVGNYQALFRLPELLNPVARTIYFFAYVSHKVLRWFTPHLLIVCLFASLFLIEKPIFLLLFVTQLFVYIISAIAIVFSLTNKLPKIISLLVFFVGMNAALLVGFFKYLSSNVNPAWERTSR